MHFQVKRYGMNCGTALNSRCITIKFTYSHQLQRKATIL